MSYKSITAYQTTGTGLSLNGTTSISGAYAHMWDAATKIGSTLISMGWTLVADRNADTPSKYIFRSPGGENGSKLNGYVGLYWNDRSGFLIFKPYVYWSTVNNAGYSEINCTNDTYLIVNNNTTNYIWVSGDMDWVTVVSKPNTNYYVGGFGYIKPFWTKVTSLTQDSPTGTYPLTNAQLTVNDASIYVSGETYQIVGTFDSGGGNIQGSRENVVIGAIDTANNIVTINSLQKKYLTGAKLGQQPYLFGIFKNGSDSYFLTPGSRDQSGTASGCGTTLYPTLMGINTAAYAGTDACAEGNWVFSPMMWTSQAASYSGAIGYLDYNMLRVNNTPVSEDTFDIGRVDSGVSTSTKTTANNTIDCSTKTWATTFTGQSLVGKIVITTSGTGMGQSRVITSYTNTTLTLSSNWSANIDTTTNFIIASECWRYFKDATNGSGWVVKEII